MAIEPGDRVRVDYLATLPDGAVFDTSVREVAEAEGLVGPDAPGERSFEPIELVVGDDGPLGDLAGELVGLEVGDEETVYAEISDDRVVSYDRDTFESMVDDAPEVGAAVQAADGATGTITAVDGDSVAVDFSHALAGRTLEVRLRVARVEKA
ncbi:MAG: peptidylprolyl isomerase [Halobacteriales archaeon]